MSPGQNNEVATRLVCGFIRLSVQVFSLIIQTYVPAQSMTSSSFALVVASVHLLEFRLDLIRVADFLFGL